MKLSSTQKAYLAGFLDGDGSIYVRAKPNQTYRFGYQIAPYIVFYQSSKSGLFKKVYSLIGFGHARMRADGVTEYIISKRNNIIEFINLIYPFLILKQKQAKLLLQILKQKDSVSCKEDFEKILNLCNQFQDLNYSKRRKIRTMRP
jgi:intein-encoded DNA endonuclease-like protein